MLPLLLALSGVQTVTYASLCEEAWNLNGLCEFPNPSYVTQQSSSFDRASVGPGLDSWFANNDAGNFYREENTCGRLERVLCDVKGPGVLVRYWSPNPGGVTRIYIDENPVPVIEAKSTELLSGKHPAFPAPLSHVTSNGWNLYAPIPYQKSLKVTVDGTDNDASKKMYYQVQYRTYPSEVQVEPFRLEKVKSENLARKVESKHAAPVVRSDAWGEKAIAPGSSLQIERKGPGVIRALIVGLPKEPVAAKWTDNQALHNVLRSVRVKATFDGEECVDAPLGDLMGTPIGLQRLDSMPVVVNDNGTLALYLPMPFKESAKFSFINEGSVPVRLRVATEADPYRWTDRSMHFKAQWKAFRGRTRPMVDLEFLNARGAGVFIGCNIGISNPVPGWWGEGDEKMYLNGEAFPSTFGTGTEDYFGYGWCDPALFEHPYHFQTRCDGPGNKGHSNIGRWHVLDRMPFEESFRFDMELWHWVDCDMTYSRTAYWYAKPQGSPPSSDSGSQFLPPFIEGAKRVTGAIEGEDLKVVTISGGVTEQQSFGELSNGKQLWWRDAKVDDSLHIRLKVPAPGRYRVFGRFCFAKDYGRHVISLGQLRHDIDFYGELGWKTIDLGTAEFGDETDLTVSPKDPNSKAQPRNMFGLDYLLFVRE